MTAFALIVLFIAYAEAGIPLFYRNGSLSTNPKIVGGIDAPVGEYPFQAAIVHTQSPLGSFFCAGTVVTSSSILTAAHCVQGETSASTSVYAGSQKLNSGGTLYEVKQIISHENYKGSSDSYRNDIAIIKLTKPLVFGENIAQVTLPSADFDRPVGEHVSIVGWGATDPAGLTVSNNLQYLGDNYRVLSQADCQTAGVPKFAGQICANAGNYGQGACRGDSGGPLIYKGLQLGITSFGAVPCGQHDPTFYTYIPHYMPWLKKNLGEDAENLQIA